MRAKFEYEVFYSIEVHMGSMYEVLCRVAVEKRLPAVESRVILRELELHLELHLVPSLIRSNSNPPYHRWDEAFAFYPAVSSIIQACQSYAIPLAVASRT